jgi:glycosyltransferase involved in cell wall biosynthesis
MTRVAAIRSCDGDLQGPEHLILMLADRLRGSRFDHLILNLWDGTPPRVALHEEAGRRGLDSRIVETRSDYDPSIVPRLRRVLREAKVDLVHTYGAKAEIAALLATAGLGMPLVGSYFGCFPMWPLHVQLAEATSLVTLRLFQEVLANSESLRRELLQLLFSRRRVHVVPSYVDTAAIIPPTPEERRAARRRLDIPEGRSVLIQLARLHPEKGHRYMLEALAIIRAKRPDVLYLAVGEGHLAGALGRRAVALGLGDHVRLTGFYPDRLAALRAADIMVVPSVREGISVALLEGMAIGLPVVATRVHGSAEVVAPRESGHLVAARAPHELATAVLALLDDPIQARAMGLSGRRRVEAHYSAERVVGDVMASYGRLLGGQA